MKEVLDENSRHSLIAYRLQRAYETLKEAEVMRREQFYNAAITGSIMLATMPLWLCS